MAGISDTACMVLARQLEHLSGLTCILDIICNEAVPALKDDNGPCAAALQAACHIICVQSDEMQAELRKMRADPQWNGTPAPA